MPPKKNTDFKVLLELLEEAKESAKFHRELVQGNLEDKFVDAPALEAFIRKKKEVLETEEGYAREDALNSLQSKLCDDRELVLELFEKYVHTAEEDSIEKTEEEKIEIMGSAIKDVLDLINSDDEIAEIQGQTNASIQEYIEYLASPEYEEKRLARIEQWQKELEKTQSPLAQSELRRRIYVEKSHYTLDFLFQRFEDPKTREEEKASLLDAFFDSTKSAYVMKRFKEKARQAWINEEVYRHFFGLEEHYLEEEYHVYNNFFLVAVLRYIAYADVIRNISEIKALIDGLTKITYNRFVNEVVRETFLNAVRRLLNIFKEDRDRFERENILHPKHPHRIQKEAERERVAREAIYKKLIDEKLVDVIDEEIKSLDMEKLYAFVRTKTEEREERDRLCSSIMEKLIAQEGEEPQGPVVESPMDLDALSIEELREKLKELENKPVPIEDQVAFSDELIKKED